MRGPRSTEVQVFRNGGSGAPSYGRSGYTDVTPSYFNSYSYGWGLELGLGVCG